MVKNFGEALPYVTDEDMQSAFMTGLSAGRLFARAVGGEKLSVLQGLSDEQADMVDQLSHIAVAVCSFDRSSDSTRRCEARFRKHLLPAAAQLAHPEFNFDDEAIEKPGDYSELAWLTHNGRSIVVVRTMLGVSETLTPAIRPGLVGYRMLVSDKQ